MTGTVPSISLFDRVRRVLTFIRFSHTIFALPFAVGSTLVAANGWPSPRLAGLILLCMVFARTAAMVFNRLADWEIDQRNPRTAGRHKLVSRPLASVVLLGSSAAFVATAWCINPLVFWLSPVALGIVFLYSVTKRFTSFTQLFLGLALAVAPVGAWLAVTGKIAWAPVVLALAVLPWVAGFDLIYATQDYEFDKKEGLRSMVVWLGVEKSLRLAVVFHVAMWLLLGVFGWMTSMHWPFWAGLVLTAGALIYEHRIAATRDLNRINEAFFNANAFVGAVFVVSIAIDLAIR
ncbi:MAG TPA: UbiA-like polyprenyltransferase [Chthoniobacterales bacterium]